MIGGTRARIRDDLPADPRPVGDGEVEFVHDVTSCLPSQVIGELMGLPEEDWPKIHQWAEVNTCGQDRDLNPDGDDPADRPNSITEMAMYAIGFAAPSPAGRAPRRPHVADPRYRVRWCAHERRRLRFSFFVQLVTAGNDTTKTMLSSGLLALLEHPEQLAELRADPTLIAGAVEEILRWANPLHYFRRTATADTELRGVDDQGRRQGGDVLHVGEPRRGGLRRPAAVRHPPRSRTRICRSASPSTSASACTSLGSKGGCSSRSCWPRIPTIELIGEPRRTRSNLNNALKELPVRLGR